MSARGDGGAPLSPEQIREALDAVLARAEFLPREGVMERLAEWLAEVFPDLDLSAAGSILELFFWGVVVLLGGGVGWLLVSLYRARGARRATASGVRQQGEIADRVAELCARARAARGAGDLVLALRLFFFALAVGLGDRGALEYHDSWTNRELLLRGEVRGELEGQLAALVEELDRKGFGRARTAPEDVDRLEGLCRDWLGVQP